MSKYKFVYSDWLNLNCGSIPIANGMHPKVVEWMKAAAIATPNATPDPIYSRTYEIESTYQTKGSGLVFHHANLLFYFRKYYGANNIVSEDQIDPNDECAYFLPIEIEGPNINYLHRHFNFIINKETITYRFKDSISPKIMEHIKTGKVKLLLGCLTEFSHGVDTLKYIEQAFRMVGIDPKNVIYIMGNTTTNYTGDIVQATSHASLEQQATIADRYPIERSSLGYLCDYPRPTELDSNKLRPKKYLSWNRTINRPHRFALAYIALKYDMLKDGLFSFLNAFSYRAIDHLPDLIDDPIDQIKPIADKIHAMLPYEIDTQDLTQQGKESFQTNENNNKDFYLDAYLHITSETIFDAHSSPFMSEKTFRPIMNLQPFIYVGNYKGLEELHRLGFKTFDGYIDESYDQEQDPRKRFAMIEKEIQRFNAMSIEELHNWYYSLTDILIYNQQHFLGFKEYNPLKELFDRY